MLAFSSGEHVPECLRSLLTHLFFLHISCAYGTEGWPTHKGPRVRRCQEAKLAVAPISAKTPTATLLTAIRFTGPDACPDTDDLVASQELQDDRTPSHCSQSPQTAPTFVALTPWRYKRGTLTTRSQKKKTPKRPAKFRLSRFDSETGDQTARGE